jgi:type II secretion system protein C
MLAAGLRAAQLLLVALCVFVTYEGARSLVSAAPIPDTPQLPAVHSEDGAQDFTRYRVIQERNLFQSASSEPAPPPPPPVEEEDLEESKLRLRLLGTAASEIPELSVASIEDLVGSKRVAVRVGDQVAGATLVRVERHRVVLDNHGKREQLSLDETQSSASSPALQKARGRSQRARNRQRPQAPRREARKEALARTRAAQAAQGGAIGRILQSITSGEDLGLEAGERVTAIDGFELADREQVEELMKSLDQQGPRRVTVKTSSGDQRVIEVDAP